MSHFQENLGNKIENLLNKKNSRWIIDYVELGEMKSEKVETLTGVIEVCGRVDDGGRILMRGEFNGRLAVIVDFQVAGIYKR